MRPSFAFFASIPLVAALTLATSTALAESREQPFAITATNLWVQGHEVPMSPGLQFTTEPVNWLRVGLGAGGFGAGTGSWSWQQINGGVRILDSGPTEGAVRGRIFGAAGVARFTTRDTEGDGPGPSDRETFGLTTALDFDATYFGRSGTGFTARLGAGCFTVLDQSLRQKSPSSSYNRDYRERYRFGPLFSISLGYSW